MSLFKVKYEIRAIEVAFIHLSLAVLWLETSGVFNG